LSQRPAVISSNGLGRFQYITVAFSKSQQLPSHRSSFHHIAAASITSQQLPSHRSSFHHIAAASIKSQHVRRLLQFAGRIRKILKVGCVPYRYATSRLPVRSRLRQSLLATSLLDAQCLWWHKETFFTPGRKLLE
jgi:hypothetical protein